MWTDDGRAEHEAWLDEQDEINRWWIAANSVERAAFSDLDRAFLLGFLWEKSRAPRDGTGQERVCRWTIAALHALRTEQVQFVRKHPLPTRRAMAPADLDQTGAAPKVEAQIALLDNSLSAEIMSYRAPEAVGKLLGKRERQREEAREYAVLTAVRARMETYLLGISDKKLHYPGAGDVYPSRRFWMRKFIQQYVLTHGHLPTGVQNVSVPGFSTGSHDLTELSAPDAPPE